MIKETNTKSGQSLPQNTYTESIDIIREGYLLEEWRTIKYYYLNGELLVYNNYEVNRDGIVRNKLTGNIFIPKISSSTQVYPTVQLQKPSGKNVHVAIHIILASTFIGARPKKFDVDHIDRDPLNYKLNNLRYLSRSDNEKNRKERKFREVIAEKYDSNTNNLLETYRKSKTGEKEWKNRVSSARKTKARYWIKYDITSYELIKSNKVDVNKLEWKEIIEENSESPEDVKVFISEIGMIKKTKDKKFTTYYSMGNEATGYQTISLGVGKHKDTYKIHRLVAKYFLNDGVDITGLFIDHISTDIYNNSSNNLRICNSQSENMMNKLTRLKLSKQIKCHDNINGGWIYFMSIEIAENVLGINHKLINKILENGENYSKHMFRLDTTHFELWDDEDYDKYFRNEIDVISKYTEELNNTFSERRLEGKPIKFLDKNETWIYFLDLKKASDYLGLLTTETLSRYRKFGKYKEYHNFSDWNTEDFNNWWTGNLVNINPHKV